MSQKTEKPVLQGQRIKTRKRDEKEKYDPSAFRNAIIQGLNEAGNDLDQVSKFLDTAGGKLDYRRYGEPLLDVLIAGGILAPGGFIAVDVDSTRPSRTDQCVFGAKLEHATLKQHYGVLYKLIRRYKYMEKPLVEETKKLIMFLKGFSEEERQKLAIFIGICLANSLGNPECLNTLFEEHLVKEGIALEFAIHLFRAWLEEKDMSNLGSSLKRGGLETKLLNLLPFNKRNIENFEIHFKAAGLDPIVEYQRVKASGEMRKQIQIKVRDMICDEEPAKDIVNALLDDVRKHSLSEHEVVVLVWNALMSVVEWNKKEDLVADQAIKHLRTYAPTLLAPFATNPRAELCLMVKVQEFCYDNMAFHKLFHKIILLFYKTEIVSEDTILKWNSDGHSQKGKGIFLEQMKKFVEWLQNAEEESEEEDEEEED